jgi:hypothetical protein
MKIIIESIPHASQRYPTCGDWFEDPDGTLRIKVSEEMGADSCLLVALHELFERKLLEKRGVTTQQVDDFDIAYEKAHREGGTLEGKRLDESEPGDDPTAPYHSEHEKSTALEMIAAMLMGVDWAAHNVAVEALP